MVIPKPSPHRSRASTLLTALLLILPTLRTLPAAGDHQEVYVAFDIETTGLSARHARIVEIAAVKFTGQAVLGHWQRLIHPGHPIPAAAMAIHGITDAMVADAPAFPALYPAFQTFITNATLIAHNADFDLRFLQAEAKRHGLPPLTNAVIDTLPLARTTLPHLPQYTLEFLVKTLALPAQPHHRATADATHAMHLFQYLQQTRNPPPD